MSTMTKHAPGMFCWSELATTDQEAAKKFYTALFDWTFDDSPIGGGETYTMLMKNGKNIGALYSQQKEQRERRIPPNWLPYVAVESADQIAAKIKQGGGKVLTEPFDVMAHGRMAVFQDPADATFAVWQANQHTGAGLVNEVGSVCWNELLTRDPSKAGPFYKQVFGWTDEAMPMPQGTYTMFKKDRAQAAGMMKITPEMGTLPSHWEIYFSVDDCDKCVAKAKQLGGKVMKPPADIPNVGRFAVLQDPQGAYFAIIAMTRKA